MRILDHLHSLLFKVRSKRFESSSKYWDERYLKGGNSGAGSYNKLAEFKADVINDFIVKNGIESVIEWGCGDGNQLSLFQCPTYIGIDVSKTAIEKCKERYKNDTEKIFYEKQAYHQARTFDLSLSLDVIYHLVEDDVFSDYMDNLFHSSKKYVCIYASNTEEQISTYVPHVRHRRFTDYIQNHFPDWMLYVHIPNAYPYDPGDPSNTSFSEFYIFQKKTQSNI